MSTTVEDIIRTIYARSVVGPKSDEHIHNLLTKYKGQETLLVETLLEKYGRGSRHSNSRSSHESLPSYADQRAPSQPATTSSTRLNNTAPAGPPGGGPSAVDVANNIADSILQRRERDEYEQLQRLIQEQQWFIKRLLLQRDALRAQRRAQDSEEQRSVQGLAAQLTDVKLEVLRYQSLIPRGRAPQKQYDQLEARTRQVTKDIAVTIGLRRLLEKALRTHLARQRQQTGSNNTNIVANASSQGPGESNSNNTNAADKINDKNNNNSTNNNDFSKSNENASTNDKASADLRGLLQEISPALRARLEQL